MMFDEIRGTAYLKLLLYGMLMISSLSCSMPMQILDIVISFMFYNQVSKRL